MSKYSNKFKFDTEVKLRELGIIFYKEYEFNPRRNWAFDYVLSLEHKIALEIEGGLFLKCKDGKTGGRHSRGAGYVKDIEKYNSALLLGWRVFRLPSGFPKMRNDLLIFIRKLIDNLDNELLSVINNQ